MIILCYYYVIILLHYYYHYYLSFYMLIYAQGGISWVVWGGGVKTHPLDSLATSVWRRMCFR